MKMKRISKCIIAVIGLMAFAMEAQAQSCTELFNRANTLRDSGKYEEAIKYYKQARQCDPFLKKDCNTQIAYCGKRLKETLYVSMQEITIPYQGSDKEITVHANGKWSVEGSTEWCNTNAYNTKNLLLECREANNDIRSRTTTLTVKSGVLYKTIRVTQEGRPEYIEASAKSLSFPANGTEDDISIESNANWDVASLPSWCKVEKRADGIHIIVQPNDKVMERTDDIIIESPSKSVTIKVYQSAGEEHLTLSQNNLVLDKNGDTHFVKVYTDAASWFVGDFPTWMNVQRVGKDSLRIECGKNVANGEPRYGSVQVKTDRQTTGILVTQSPREHQDLIFPDSKIVSGRNFSFGVSASYYVPFVSASAGGDYCGSVVDYGLGNSSENASYKSATGFSLGLFADLRLYKNIFLMAGVNFTQIKYNNTFDKNTTTTFSTLQAYQYLKGEVQNSYKEDYTHTMIEIPILASYRFKVNDMSHVQLNFGPVLNIGLSAKMKFSGNTDCESLKAYSANGTQIGTQPWHTAVNTEFDLYSNSVSWKESFTIGNDADQQHDQKFQSSPLNKFNCGLRVGAAYEWAGISLGLYYTYMFTNMANKNYWENERWTVLNVSDTTMKGYKQRINTFEIKLAYTLRYLKSKK